MCKMYKQLEEELSFQNKEIEFEESRQCQTCPRKLYTKASKELGQCLMCRGIQTLNGIKEWDRREQVLLDNHLLYE